MLLKKSTAYVTAKRKKTNVTMLNVIVNCRQRFHDIKIRNRLYKRVCPSVLYAFSFSAAQRCSDASRGQYWLLFHKSMPAQVKRYGCTGKYQKSNIQWCSSCVSWESCPEWIFPSSARIFLKTARETSVSARQGRERGEPWKWGQVLYGFKRVRNIYRARYETLQVARHLQSLSSLCGKRYNT